MNGNTTTESKDRKLALLGLAATHRVAAVDACPSDEQLAAFIDNSLSGQEREHMLAHLNRCHQCYQNWLEMASYLLDAAELDAAKPVPQTSQPAGSSAFLERIASWFTPSKLAVPVTALVALACLVVLWPMASDLDGQIGARYVAVIPQDSLRRTLADLVLPWDQSALSFNGAQPTPPTQAFGAGLWEGRAVLSDSGDKPMPPFLIPPAEAWPDSEWKEYYQLGRWAVLLWALAKAGQVEPDWYAHQQILEMLLTGLKQRLSKEPEASQAVAALERLQPLLADVQSQTSQPTYTELSRQLEMIINQLAPS